MKRIAILLPVNTRQCSQDCSNISADFVLQESQTSPMPETDATPSAICSYERLSHEDYEDDLL